MSRTRTILVSVDFSESSRAAAREAARIAGTTKSAICLLHAAAGTQAIDWAKELATNACGSLQALHDLAAFIVAERLDPLTTTGLVRTGSAAEVIIEYAHEIRPELIVIGLADPLSSEPALDQLVKNVRANVRCPVLTVPATEPADQTRAGRESQVGQLQQSA